MLAALFLCVYGVRLLVSNTFFCIFSGEIATIYFTALALGKGICF